jgi:hypothetical protein
LPSGTRNELRAFFRRGSVNNFLAGDKNYGPRRRIELLWFKCVEKIINQD